MRKLFIMIFLLSLFNCEKNPISHKEKFFDPQKLPLLSLSEVKNFWQDDSIKQISAYKGMFADHPGFLAGIRCRGDKKGVIVYVFKSQADAIQAMEGRIKNVACVIQPGAGNEILKGKWWFSDCIPDIVFVCQWNTIIEVSCYSSDYAQVKALLMETAAEIAKRVDAKSS